MGSTDDWLRGMAQALGILTRVPVGDRGAGVSGAALGWFPLVGAAIGASGAFVWLTAGLVVPPGAAAVAALVTTVMVTGALHLDGLADTMDALVGGRDRDHRRALLDDPRHGTYGVGAVVLQLLAQWSLLAGLTPGAGAVALVLSHTLGRAGAVWAMVGARPLGAGLGAWVLRTLRVRDVMVASALAVVVAVGGVGGWGIAVAAAAGGAAVIVSRWGQRRLGGVNGDVLGAAEQLAETAALAGLVVLVGRGVAAPWW